MKAYHELTWQEQIEDIAGLPDDWDSYGAPAPGREHAERLRTVIAAVIARYCLLPWHVAPGYVEWQVGQARLELDPKDDGTYGYLLLPDRDKDTGWREVDAATLDDVLACLAEMGAQEPAAV